MSTLQKIVWFVLVVITAICYYELGSSIISDPDYWFQKISSGPSDNLWAFSLMLEGAAVISVVGACMIGGFDEDPKYFFTWNIIYALKKSCGLNFLILLLIAWGLPAIVVGQILSLAVYLSVRVIRVFTFQVVPSEK